jgi:RES domain-containing protein
LRTPSLRVAAASAPRRQLSGRFWHQGPTAQPFGAFADPADTFGRYHRVGGAGVWYASSQEQAAWAAWFRHFIGAGIDPSEALRRVGHVDVTDLEVLDLTDQAVRDLFGVTEADLVRDDYSVTQEIAEQARLAGFGGILAPSAALPGRRTLVVFPSGAASRTPGPSSVRRPPPRMGSLRGSIPARRHR